MKPLFQHAAIALLFASPFSALKATDQYSLTKLGPDGSSFSTAYAINDNGQITLRSLVGGGQTSVIYYYQNRYTITDLAGSFSNFPFASPAFFIFHH